MQRLALGSRANGGIDKEDVTCINTPRLREATGMLDITEHKRAAEKIRGC